MKTKGYKKILIVISMLSCSIAVVGQQPSDSLMHYLEIAAKNNPTVLQKFSEYQAALQKAPQAGSLPDPDVSVGIFLKPMEVLSGNQVAEIRLMQMFPWFGVLKSAKDEMSLMANAKYESFRDAKLQVFYDVQRIWYELYRVRQNILISEKNIEILRAIERLSLVKYKAAPAGGVSSSTGKSFPGGLSQSASSGPSGMQGSGGGSGSSMGAGAAQSSSPMQSSSMGAQATGSGLSDLYRIQIEIGELVNSIALLKNQQASVIARFNTTLNRSVRMPLLLPDTLLVTSVDPQYLLVSDSLFANNPMLGMLNYEQKSLEAKQRMVTRMGYPMVGLGVNYTIISKNAMSTSSMNGKDMVMPMVTVTLPIYRKKYRAMQNEAAMMKTATEQGYRATANSLQAEYYEAIQLYQDAQRRVTLYATQSQLTKKTLDIMLRSFAASTTGLTDLLRVRQQLLDYQLKQVEAVVDNNTAVAWLNRLMAVTQNYQTQQ
jgi:Outer membrane protein